MMNFRGTLWMMLILVTPPHLTCEMLCPSSCLCNFKGAVKCVGPTITEIPMMLPLHTYLLQLNGTNMNVIYEMSLAEKDLLLRFSLTHSHLHTIHPRAFYAAPQLKSVKLSSNDLSTLPARVFSPLTTLEQLHLDGNQLETIAPEMLEGLVMLEDLDLSRNKLGSPAADVFDGLANLKFLNLGRNSIKKLPPTIFHSLTSLEKLMLYNNELEVLEEGIFDGLVNLEDLKIHANHITSLPSKVFWSLKNLKILTLSSNRLQVIPEKSFYNMPKLINLTIYNNPLLSLPDQLMGHMPDMTDLYLYATNLTTVPENLFANMSGLLRLNFHFNERLNELPSDAFCCLPNLQKLSLKANKLLYLHPQLFSTLTTLGILLLNDNELQSLPENIFQGLGQLLEIDLKNNHIQTLPGDIFMSNTVLKALRLSGNPWNCACSIRGIAKWIRQHEQVVLDRGDVICHSPAYQMLRTLGSLRDEEFNVCDVTTTMTTPTTKPSSLHTTISSTSLQTPTSPLPTEELFLTTKASQTFSMSRTFYDTLVIEESSEFVHHNLHRGWMHVWFLPSDRASAGFLMFCHILLVATGLVLILAAMYVMYRLNKIMNELKAQCAHTQGEQNTVSGMGHTRPK